MSGQKDPERPTPHGPHWWSQDLGLGGLGGKERLFHFLEASWFFASWACVTFRVWFLLIRFQSNNINSVALPQLTFTFIEKSSVLVNVKLQPCKETRAPERQSRQSRWTKPNKHHHSHNSTFRSDREKPVTRHLFLVQKPPYLAVCPAASKASPTSSPDPVHPLPG